MPDIDPAQTYFLLLIVQALHLLHHRLAKRHIGFTEVLAGTVLLVPPGSMLVPAFVLVAAHLLLITAQVVGSLFIRRLSPDWR
jgi:hypothetical protein